MTDEERAVVDAIRQAERCDDYYRERGEPCEGLNGCPECLAAAAAAVLEAIAR